MFPSVFAGRVLQIFRGVCAADELAHLSIPAPQKSRMGAQPSPSPTAPDPEPFLSYSVGNEQPIQNEITTPLKFLWAEVGEETQPQMTLLVPIKM